MKANFNLTIRATLSKQVSYSWDQEILFVRPNIFKVIF